MAGDASAHFSFVSDSANLKTTVTDTLCQSTRIKSVCHRAFIDAPPDFICFYNFHPLNVSLARMVRRMRPSGLRAVYLHEPAKPSKSGYGLKGRLFFYLVEMGQRRLVRSCTDVIVPSPYAEELFQQHFRDHAGRTHYAPLLIKDQTPNHGATRQYFSMVGRFNFTKRLDPFIDAINMAVAEGCDLSFQIVTASNIASSLAALTPQARPRVRVINKPNLADEEVSQALAESLAVLCLHSNVTQSGVIPLAFMNATPAIVLNARGFTQYVNPAENGWLVPERFSARDLVNAMLAVRKDFSRLSCGARQTYETVFSDANCPRYYAWVPPLLSCAVSGGASLEFETSCS